MDGSEADVDLNASSSSLERFLAQNGLEMSMSSRGGSEDSMSLLRAAPRDTPLSLDDFGPDFSSDSVKFTTPPTTREREETKEADNRFDSLALASQNSVVGSISERRFKSVEALRNANGPQLMPRRFPQSAEPRLQTSLAMSTEREAPVRRILDLESTNSSRPSIESTTSRLSALQLRNADDLRAMSLSALPQPNDSGSERMLRQELSEPPSPASQAESEPFLRSEPPPAALSPAISSSSRPATPLTTQGKCSDEFKIIVCVDAQEEWSVLTTLLSQHGMSRVIFVPAAEASSSFVPEKESLCSVVHEIVSQLERRGQIIQDLVLDASRTSNLHTKAESSINNHEKKIAELTSALAVANQEVKLVQKERDEVKVKLEQESKAWKIQKSKLEQQLKVSEHRVKAKEFLIDRMQQKIQQQVDKDELTKSKEKVLFQKLQQREPRKTSAADMKSMEIIRMYESQRAKMTDEIKSLQNQVQDLCADLRTKENQSSSSVNPIQPNAMLERFEIARREQERAATTLRQREALIQEKMGAIEAELMQSKEAMKELKEENANLHLEVESRPTIQQYRQAQRRIHALERQLADQKLAMDEATDLEQLRKYMGTQALIQRDRLNAKLQLNRLNTLPRETALEVIKEVCRELDLSDVTLIVPSLRKICAVVLAVPRMESFIRDVQACINKDRPTDQVMPLEKVVPILKAMQNQLRELDALKQFRSDVLQGLAKRCRVLKPTKEPEDDSTYYVANKRAISTIQELVEFETHFLQEKEMYQQALQNVENRPDILVNKMVQHFRHVFGVKTMEGVFPKINELYIFVNKMNSALAELKTTLNLPQDASITTTLNALKAKSPTSRPAQENYVVDNATGPVTGLQQVRQHYMIIKQLKEELGATTDDEIVPRTKRLMELLSLSIHS